LIVIEDLGKAPRFNFEKISSEENGRCAPAVVRGWCISTDATNVTPIQRAPKRRSKRRVSSVIFVRRAV